MSRPSVTLKAGVSLDGRIAAEDGRSQWITGEAARAAGRRLRASHDAILVGTGTLLADDPALTTRIPGAPDPLPVLLDRQRRCPPDAQVLTAGERPLIFTGPGGQGWDIDADVVEVPVDGERLDLEAVLAELSERGVHALLVEGGARVHRSLLDLDVVDRVELFVSPRLLAGGPSWLAGPGYSLDDEVRFRFAGAIPVGEDLHVRLVRREG